MDTVSPQGMTEDGMLLYIKYLDARSGSKKYTKLYLAFGAELFTFLTLFASESFRVPRVDYLNKIAGYCEVYAYLSNRGFTDQAYLDASKRFTRREQNLRGVVSNVEKMMKKGVENETGNKEG